MKQHAYSQLPDGYEEIASVNLQKDKKLAIWIQLLALGIAVLFAVPAAFVVSIATLFDLSDGLALYCLRFTVFLIGSLLYVVLHELVHGIAMKVFGAQTIKYGFTGLYAYAGSNTYFSKSAYFVIALAPIIIWGIVLGIVSLLVPIEWFWVVYGIQVFNLSGAAGDLYVTVRFWKLPSDILVYDNGVAMQIYAKKQ